MMHYVPFVAIQMAVPMYDGTHTIRHCCSSTHRYRQKHKMRKMYKAAQKSHKHARPTRRPHVQTSSSDSDSDDHAVTCMHSSQADACIAQLPAMDPPSDAIAHAPSVEAIEAIVAHVPSAAATSMTFGIQPIDGIPPIKKEPISAIDAIHPIGDITTIGDEPICDTRLTNPQFIKSK